MARAKAIRGKNGRVHRPSRAEARQELDLVDSATPEASQGAANLERCLHSAARCITRGIRPRSGISSRRDLAWLNVIPMAFFSVNPAMLDKNHEARAQANNLSNPFSKKLD